MRTIIFSFLFLFSLKCNEGSSEKNIDNINKIKIGMKDSEVREILGVPDLIEIPPLTTDEYDLRYLSPSGYSDDFHIFLSKKDSIVIRIANGL